MTSNREAPRKRIWLRLTCGGCFCLVVLLIFTGVALWHALKNWESGHSAWEKLPPSTVAAVEIHDLNALMNHVIRDPGAMSILSGLSGRYNGVDATRVGLRNHSYGDLLRDFRNVYTKMGPLHTAVLPNTVTLGLAGEMREPFLIFRPTTWMRWLEDVPEAGAGSMRLEKAEGTNIYVVAIDGWFVAALSPEIVRLVADNWAKPTLPLGPGPEKGGVYLLAAFRRQSAAGDEAPAAPGGGGLMHADPFAANAAASVGKEDAPCARILLAPVAREGWLLRGDANRHGSFSIEAPGGEIAAPPQMSGAGHHDLAVAVRLAERERREVLRPVSDLAARGASPDLHPRERLFWQWLWDGWLARIDGGLVLFGDPPISPEGSGSPSLPVFSLGWDYPENAGGLAEATAFTRSLTLFLDAVASPGGNPLMQAIRQSVSYRIDESAEGMGGRIFLPAAVVAGAKPAWFFPRGVAAPSGWFATDPSGITGDREVAVDVMLPESSPASVSAGVAHWRLGRDFHQALFDLIDSRLSLVPESVWPGKREAERSCLLAKNLLGVYPAGSLSAALVEAEEGREARFRVEVPFGVEYEWE